ncbi:Der GTPase-activating protein YihI [Glaciecola sp. 1036]|uniref:Der GTPase-activating protein YihI n=1 Tax=Alteromonadaceae TaxID=72275 RepID=UPI003D0458EB
MAGRKKTRKVGKIGVSKTDAPRVVQKDKKEKRHKGHKAGSRQHLAENNKNKEQSAGKLDPRIGSKKPIDLYKHKNKKPESMDAPKTRFFSPQEELDAIENDPRLDALLEKQETKRLTNEEQTYLDKTLARHRKLCDLLGIDLEQEDSKNDKESDPFSGLDAIKLDDYDDEK